MNIKKLAAFVLSFGLVVPHVAYAEGECGSAPSIDYEKVKQDFTRSYGSPSGFRCYYRGDVKGKKRDVYVLNLPNGSGVEVAEKIRTICYDHLGINPKNITRKETANVVAESTGGAAAFFTTATATIASADVPDELEVFKLPLIIVCGGCACCCCCLSCCAGCTSCGIDSKSKDIKKIKKFLNKLRSEGAYLNSNVLIIAFDKRDSCCCCRKSVYVGFKYIDSLDETIAPVVKNENYFSREFTTEEIDL